MEENKNQETQTQKPQNIKYKNMSIYVYVGVIVFAWLFGQLMINGSSTLFVSNAFVLTIVSILIGYVVFNIVYEVGKIIFSKIAGFKLIYTSIFGFGFYRTEEDKIKFKFMSIEDFGGSTLLSPKDGKKITKNRALLHFFGGSILCVIVYIIGLFFIKPLMNAFSEGYGSTLNTCYYLIGGIGLVIIILHLVPFMSDGILDGFALRLCMASEDGLESYLNMLRQEEALRTGLRPLTYTKYDSYYEPFKAKALLYNYYYCLDNKMYDEAEEICALALSMKEYLAEEDLPSYYVGKYYFLLLKGDFENIEKEFWKEEKAVRKACTSYSNFEALKTSLLIAAFIEPSYDLYEHISSRIEKLVFKYYAGRQDSEEDLIDRSLDFIEKNRPDWFRNNEE